MSKYRMRHNNDRFALDALRLTPGFTLIELMVVISIIGLLSAGAVAGVNIARTKARDAKRTADVAQIQKALALLSSSGTTYPGASSGTCITGDDVLSTALKGAGLMQIIPGDPVAKAVAPATPPAPQCYFYVSADGSTYSIQYYLEREKKQVTVGQ